MDRKKILDVCNLTKNYGNFVALKNVSFSVEEGVIVGLLGKNGAGKTTLMKTILGLLCNYDGQIKFEGKPINHKEIKTMRKISSLVDVKFYEDMTAYENLNYLLMADQKLKKIDRKQRIVELLEMVGLENNINDKVKSFSFGMKQRLALAQTFLHDAKLIILDEPFVGLDPVGIEFMKNMLRDMRKERNVTIIFSSHQLEEVSDLADEIIAIFDGTVKYTGTLEELQNANRKYIIWFCGEEKEVIIPYDSKALRKTIHEYLSKGIEISKIEISENALYQLFV